MYWNWQQKDWPNFRWDKAVLETLETDFLYKSGVLIGTLKHFSEKEKSFLTLNIMTDEAVKTSEIEGEYLERESVQSSISKNLGLQAKDRRVRPAERGIADMLVDLYHNHQKPLSHSMLCNWHKMLVGEREDLKDIGRYRLHDAPMQIVSGPFHKPKIHFEAPPSAVVKKEMKEFLAWFSRTAPNGDNPLSALTRTGIAHLYFVSIHPFEDGNGRIGRALAEKSLTSYVKQPTLIALSQTIQRHRKAYYDALEYNNKKLEITNWLVYFANIVLSAQEYTQQIINFIIAKAKFYELFKGKFNERQQRVIERIFQEGVEGFKGGLSAENYIRITGTSRATATRDLQGLLELGAVTKTGELKSTRYHINISWK